MQNIFDVLYEIRVGVTPFFVTICDIANDLQNRIRFLFSFPVDFTFLLIVLDVYPRLYSDLPAGKRTQIIRETRDCWSTWGQDARKIVQDKFGGTQTLLPSTNPSLMMDKLV
jgi:hypothetical protein